MPYKKGQSGNPSGRPKLTDKQKDYKEMLREYTPTALEHLIEIAEDTSHRDRFNAIRLIIDRAYGRGPMLLMEDESNHVSVHIFKHSEREEWEKSMEEQGFDMSNHRKKKPGARAKKTNQEQEWDEDSMDDDDWSDVTGE